MTPELLRQLAVKGSLKHKILAGETALSKVNPESESASQYTRKQTDAMQAEIDPKLLGRITKPSKRGRRCLLYPEDSIRTVWDLFGTLLIIVTCMMSPIMLAFPELQTTGVQYFDLSINIFFMFDIILNFRTAYYDEDYSIEDSPRVRKLIF